MGDKWVGTWRRIVAKECGGLRKFWGELMRRYGSHDVLHQEMNGSHPLSVCSNSRFKLDSSPAYPNCIEVPEGPEHVFLHCPGLMDDRRNFERILGGFLILVPLVRRMLAYQQG